MISRKSIDSKNHQDKESSGKIIEVLWVFKDFSDILWSDPVENDDGICENNYKVNEVRGCSYFFGL